MVESPCQIAIANVADDMIDTNLVGDFDGPIRTAAIDDQISTESNPATWREMSATV